MRFFSRQALVALSAFFVLSCAVHAQDDEEYTGYDPNYPTMKEIQTLPQNFKITNLLRTLDLSKPLVREITSAAVLNIASESVSDYYFPLDQGYQKNLAMITAENRKTKEKLEVVRDSVHSDGEYDYYRIRLSAPLPPGEKVQLTITTHFTDLAKPYPSHVGQSEKQQFMYFGNPYALTSYPAAKQKTTIVAPSRILQVIEHPEESTPLVTNNQVVLGPYLDVKALEHGIFEIQYQLLGPVPHVSQLRRDIEISQWGNNLAVEEHYKFVNRGADLKGQFNRLEYQRNPMAIRESNAVVGLQTQIPKLARDIYYRDEIGNISTSILEEYPDFIMLTLRPRFPIYGGWKTTWYTGYNAPLNDYLRRVPGTDRYILKVPVFVPLPLTSYDEIEIRVVLPEGAKNAKVQLPYEVESVEHSTTKTYMDSAGRYTITIKASNLIEEHRQDMLIEYEFATTMYLIKPIAATSMLLVLFATSMVASRLDFRIGGSLLKK